MESFLGIGGFVVLGVLENVGGGGCSVVLSIFRSYGRGLLVGGSFFKCLVNCREFSGIVIEVGFLEVVERVVGRRVLGFMSGYYIWYRR